MNFCIGAPALLGIAITHLGVQHDGPFAHARAFVGGLAIDAVLGQERAGGNVNPVGKVSARGDQPIRARQVVLGENPVAP